MCADRLDVEAIENRLILEAEKMSTSFLLQDLRCPKTRRVSTRLAADTSKLSVPLELDVDRDALRSRFDTLLRVAKFHGFELLRETVEGLLL